MVCLHAPGRVPRLDHWRLEGLDWFVLVQDLQQVEGTHGPPGDELNRVAMVRRPDHLGDGPDLLVQSETVLVHGARGEEHHLDHFWGRRRKHCPPSGAGAALRLPGELALVAGLGVPPLLVFLVLLAARCSLRPLEVGLGPGEILQLPRAGGLRAETLRWTCSAWRSLDWAWLAFDRAIEALVVRAVSARSLSASARSLFIFARSWPSFFCVSASSFASRATLSLYIRSDMSKSC
jgi:hypothetical protein